MLPGVRYNISHMHTLVILIAKYLIVVPVVVAGVVFLLQPRAEKKRFVFEAFLGAALAVLLAKIGSHLFYNPRPFVVGHFTPYFAHGSDNGFPSDHTLFSSYLAFLVWRYNRTAGMVLLAVAVAIGLSRVVAGVHHLIDIIGAIGFAFVGVWLARYSVERFVFKKAQALHKAADRSE